MYLWSGFLQRLAHGISKWKLWYAAIFAIVGIIANSAPIFFPTLQHMNAAHFTTGQLSFYLVGLLYAVLSIAAIPVLGWTFYKRLRSGRQQLQVPKSVRRQEGAGRFYLYQLMKFLLFVVVIPSFALSLFGVVGMINYLVSPHFASDQQTVNTGQNYLLGLGMALLASLEELWRWAMMIVVIYGARGLWQRRWSISPKFRRNTFIVSIIISSFFFGLAHVAEFNSMYQGMALLVLGLMGVLLTCVAIATRRLWIAMLVHAAYDFLVMTNLAGAVAPWIGAAATLGLVILIPIGYRGYIQIRDLHS